MRIEKLRKDLEKMNLHLVRYGKGIYGIIDLKDCGRIIRRGTIEYLQGFIDGIDYKI